MEVTRQTLYLTLAIISWALMLIFIVVGKLFKDSAPGGIGGV